MSSLPFEHQNKHKAPIPRVCTIPLQTIPLRPAANSSTQGTVWVAMPGWEGDSLRAREVGGWCLCHRGLGHWLPSAIWVGLFLLGASMVWCLLTTLPLGSWMLSNSELHLLLSCREWSWRDQSYSAGGARPAAMYICTGLCTVLRLVLVNVASMHILFFYTQKMI